MINKLNNKDTPSQEKGFLENLNQVGLFFKFLLSPVFLSIRLHKDEARLKKYNNILPQNQFQKPDPVRKKIQYLLLFLILCQITAIGALYLGIGTIGYGNPSRALSKLFSQFRVPSVKELLDIRIFSIFILSSICGKFLELWLFKIPSSHYSKMMKALKPDELKGEPWYYPERLLYLPLNNVTGEDLLRRTSMWNDAAFEPTVDICRLKGENTFLFTSAPKKPSNSTFIYDRYDEWTALMNDKLMLFNWFLGEYVKRIGYKWKDAYKDFSIAFIGQSGSGKTEAMKMWMTAFFVKHPNTRLVLADLKKTGDWDVFGPLTEPGYIIKTENETLLALTYFMNIMLFREKHMQEKSYKNILAWAEAEGIDVPPVLLVIDEFPQMAGSLKYDLQSRRDGTPANALFQLMTKGRSFGLWVIVGSQFSGSDAIPSDMNKNIKIHVTLRTGSAGESINWINSEAAFRLGKGVRKEDGSEDGQEGYAYIDAEEEFVRFWYLDDWYIVHEFYKYGVATMSGHEHFEARKPNETPRDLKKKIDGLKEQGKSENKLARLDREYLKRHRDALVKFSKSYDDFKKSPHPFLSLKKQPLALLWNLNESIEEYVQRYKSPQGDTNESLIQQPHQNKSSVSIKSDMDSMPKRPTMDSIPKKPDMDSMPKRPAMDSMSKTKDDRDLSPAENEPPKAKAPVKKAQTEEDSDFEFNQLLDQRRKKRKDTIDANRKLAKEENSKKTQSKTDTLKADESIKTDGVNK